MFIEKCAHFTHWETFVYSCNTPCIYDYVSIKCISFLTNNFGKEMKLCIRVYPVFFNVSNQC